MYYARVFGEPAEGATWGWRFGGHHVSVNHTIVDGVLVASTPCFLGADPASSPLLGPHLLRPLAGAEDLGRELVRSLDAGQLDRALLAPVAPADLVTGNRPQVSPGDRPLPLSGIFRGRIPGRDDERMAAGQRAMEEALGLRPEHLDALALTADPKGVRGRRPRRGAARPAAGPARGLRRSRTGRAGRGRAGQVRRRRRARRAGVRLGRRSAAGRAALLPRPGAHAAGRVRQHPARREPHPHRVPRPDGRLRRRRAGRALRARAH